METDLERANLLLNIFVKIIVSTDDLNIIGLNFHFADLCHRRYLS